MVSRPFGFHPGQGLAETRGGGLPACPVEECPPDVSPVAASVQACAGHEAAQAHGIWCLDHGVIGMAPSFLACVKARCPQCDEGVR